MALTLVNEQADEVVATLYEDYCRKTAAPASEAGAAVALLNPATHPTFA